MSFQQPSRWLLLLLTAAFLCGCHNNHEILPPKPSAVAPSASLKVALQMTPQPVRQMDPTTFTFRLTDRHGRPVEGASVSADLVMPTMDMGKNTVAARRQSPGLYTGTGRFSMAGDWNVVVTAIKGTERTTQTFPVPVR